MHESTHNECTESRTQTLIHTAAIDLEKFLPDGLGDLSDIQKAIPRIAKDKNITAAIERILPGIPSWHELIRGDARELPSIARSSVHLILTSPPYWTLKQYNSGDAQLGDVVDYEQFIVELDKVWERCFQALVPGGRLICVVGDVCLSRRKNGGRHTVVPLHATIQEHCRVIGFDNLAPIIWHKIANAAFEVEGSGGSFLGKPYEPNGVIKNDIEFVLMQRKSGAYRAPDLATKILSVIPESHHREWFQQIWHGVTGASTRRHPAPFPLELASRLIRMFSFVGDTVLDPFAGSGTTSIAAVGCGRNSINYEIDDEYLTLAHRRLRDASDGLFSNATIKLIR